MSQPMSNMSQQPYGTQSGSLFEPEVIKFEHIPGELIDRAQWVVWRWGEKVSSTGRRQKIPHNPVTGRRAKTSDSKTWVTFEQAHTAYLRNDRYDGIGFMLSADDPFIVIDLDDCRNPDTGEITPEALAIVARLNSYTEHSPSGTGLHIFIRIEAMTVYHAEPIEVYSDKHFITITGQPLLTVAAGIEERQEVFAAWEQETFGSPAKRIPESAPSPSSPMSDEAILQYARQAKNAEKFLMLWSGQWEQARDAIGERYPSQSEADAALIRLLAFHTQEPAQLDRLFRQSGLYRGKWEERHGKQTYGDITIAKVLSALAETAQTAHSPQSPEAPRSHSSPSGRTRRTEHIVYHLSDWQRRSETPEERTRYLLNQATAAKARVKEHLTAKAEEPLVIALPPGAGKTWTIAELAAEFDAAPGSSLAWIAPRHALFEDIRARARFTHVQGCTRQMCPDADRLNHLASSGYNVWPAHRQHQCAYVQQFSVKHSAFYVDELVATPFPVRHSGGVIDELNLPDWIDDVRIDLSDVAHARQQKRWRAPSHQAVDVLLHALSELMFEAQRREASLRAHALFTALDATLTRHHQMHLGDLINSLEQLEGINALRPRVTSADDVTEAKHAGKVVVPHIVRLLLEDRPKWARGGDWNSRMRIDADGALHILNTRRFRATPESWPFVLLDATVDETLLARLFGRPVQVERCEVTPPPRMRHIAVRVRTSRGRVKRYGQGSLVSGKHADDARDRVVRELQAILARVDPEGIRTVGLITYKGCERQLGDALGIPAERSGHFWNIRGSNAWEQCEILLVVGTPTPNLRTIEYLAGALYADDPIPIDTSIASRAEEMTEAAGDGTSAYCDPRLARLITHLINAELTQAAHRNRPLRYDGRVVVTLTAGTVDFLPMTEEITAFGDLPTQRRRSQRAAISEAQQWRLERAFEILCAEEQKINGRVLATKAGVRQAVANEWWQRRKHERERQAERQERQERHM